MTRESLVRWVLAVVVSMGAISCNELRDAPPAAPGPVPTPAASRYDIAGHWEATSFQGRRIAFDVTADGQVVRGRVNLHHDCNTGRWRATFDGFTAPIVDDAFIGTMNWKANDNGLTREGSLTVSGRFEGDAVMRGGFINSVKDIRATNEQPTGEICPTISGNYEGTKEP